MDDDEADENTSLLEITLPNNDLSKVVVTLDYLEDEIEQCLKEKKQSLREVIDELEKKFGRKLSVLDCYYVECKYIDLLSNIWLDEGFHLVSRGFDSRHPLKYVEVLNAITNFSDCYTLFGDSSVSNALITNLSEISPSCKSQEKECICELKKRCYNDILSRTSDTKNEMDFVHNFFEALKSFSDIHLFSQLIQVDIILKCADKNGSKLFLSNLLNLNFSCSKLHKLKISAKRIYNNKEYFFIEDLKGKILEYLKPVVIKESNSDGRHLLEVSGKHIVISNELGEIEKSPRFSHIEEVRFVGAGVIHIDADLSSSIWHGKNIVVYGETLIVREDKLVTWDVSGQDADFTGISEAAGTSEDGRGLKGEDGKPGESGGNVCILVESIENHMNLKIVSNGGKGSKGQNGGSGRDGKDGKYIDAKTFKEDFPPVSHLLDKKEKYMKTIDSVCQSLLSVDKCQYKSTEFDSLPKDVFKALAKGNTDLMDIYFETTTNDHCKIKFSFYNEDNWSCCQSFLLLKGALGTEGKVGGAGGCGGKGGFAGDVKVQTSKDINLFSCETAKNGADGVMGKPGRTGNPGKSGLDAGYMDCTFAIFHNVWNSVKWPKVFNPDPGNNRLTVKYFKEKTPHRVKCPLNDLYAEITQVRKTYATSQVFQGISMNALEKLEHKEAHVKRKKNISQKSIVEQYKETDSVWKINNIECAIKKVQGKMEELINETSKESEKITQETKITRQISHYQNDWYLEEIKHDVRLENKDFVTEIEDIVLSPGSTNSKKPVLLSFFKNVFPVPSTSKGSLAQPSHTLAQSLNSMTANAHMSQATYIPSTNLGIRSINSSFNVNKNKEERESSFLRPKTQNVSLGIYHLDKLKNIYCSISFDHILDKKINIKSQLTNTIFLDETHDAVSDVNDKSSHHIEKFICEDTVPCRQELARIYSDYSLDDEPLQEAFKSFIHESKNVSTNDVSELSKHLLSYNQSRELRLKDKLFPLKELLSEAKNKNLYSYLLDGVLKQSVQSKVKFENEITRDKFLSCLYKSFVVEIKKPFDWGMESFKKRVLLKFKDNLIDRGSFAASYRELLAQHYDVNILIYTTNNENNRLVLLSNHNPKAKSAIHFLMKRNKFIKLNFDYEFARLFEKYKHLGNLFYKIMFHFCSCTDEQQISDYISQRPFTSDDYSGLDSSLVVGIKTNHILHQENYIKTISHSYVSQEDTIKVKCKLEKLKTEFIGYENILHYMALHYEVEGNQIPASELCFIINQILKFSMEESRVMSLVSWIIAAQPQQLWVVELGLLKIELYLKSPLKQEVKLKWRKYIEDQTEKDRLMVFLKKLDCETFQISVDIIDELLYLMGNVPNAHIGIENINLSEWKYYLKDRFWAHHMASITDWSVEQLKILSFYFVTWENSVGKEQCMKLIDILKERSNEIRTELDKDGLLTILNSLNSKEVCFNTKLWNMLGKSDINKWQKLMDKESQSTGSERTLQQLLELIKNSGNISKNILNTLPSIESALKRSNAAGLSLKVDLNEELLKSVFSRIHNRNKRSILHKIKTFLAEITPDESSFDKTLGLLYNVIRPSTPRLHESLTKSLASNVEGHQSNECDNDFPNIILPLIELCVGLKHNKWLRNTQKLTAMMLLSNAKSTLAQVSTGEGKSLIVVTVAIIKALCNEKVHIVTSSKVLAKRDAELYKDIFELCGLTVGHNTSEHIEERKKVYSNCHIIYGDLVNFQRDYLLDRVYNKNIMGDVSFETVIVDEVDSMLLDKGNNVLYLSHNIPGLDKIEPVFIYIWRWISRPVPSDQFKDLFNIQAIKENIMYEIFGVISKENIKQLDTSMTDKQVDNTWECLIENEVIDRSGKVLQESVSNCNVDDLPEICISKVHLKYILEKVINREKNINIPKYLHSFVEDHVENWIKSGVNAMVMENGRDYIVDIDRSETVSDINPIITILDKDTGTDLVNSQWDEALHQFLQLKHGCKLSLLNLKAVFISNVSYLKLYKTLYGLTGTLGSTCERELLQEVYGVDFVTIPTAKAKKFSEEPSILCSSTKEWKKNVCKVVRRITSNKRSALIICETIKDVELLTEELSLNLCKKFIHTYTRDWEHLKIADELQPGNVIISTNLAGRGTDIKLSKQLIRNGGLYVCLTFLPCNCRVEEQAYGRVARNGEPGSAQLIFRTTTFSAKNTAAQIIDVKKQRDINELERLRDIKSFHETQIQNEESWFKKFKEAYKTLKEIDQKEEVKDILLQAFLNQWAFWLDKNKNLLLLKANLQDICTSLEHLISNWVGLKNGNLNDWLKLVKDPTQLVKLGLAYLKEGDMPSSLELFDKVIKEEPYFSEIAHYYRVCAKAKENDLRNTDILEPLKFTARKLKNRAESSQMSAAAINWLKEQDKKNIVQIDAFLEQQNSMSQIFGIFLQSIYDIVGREVQPDNFIIPGIIGKQLSKDIYKDAIENGLITKPKIKSNVTSEELLFVKDYGLSPNKVNTFISQFKGKEYQEQHFMESFEKECPFPNRETFWKNLVSCQALFNEETFVFIDMQELHGFHPSLCKLLKPKTTEQCSMSKMKIWLYQPEELNLIKNGKTQLFIALDELVDLIGFDMYQLLEKREIFICNKLATFDPTSDPLLDQFDVISIEDFQTINICEETASLIIEDLINQRVLKEKLNRHSGLYHLLIDAENIEHIDLSNYKAYTFEVRSLMSICFAYRIAFEKLKLLAMETCENISPPLPINLRNRIVFQLKENEIIEKTYVEVKADVSKILNDLYPAMLNKDGYRKLLLKVCCKMNCDPVLDVLIKNKWLIKKKDCSNPQNEIFYINPKIKKLFSKPDKTNTKEENLPEENLPKKLPNNIEEDTISQIILNRFYFIENLTHVEKVLTRSKAKYCSIGTPCFSLTPLLDVLHEKKLSSEMEIFSLNGFDQLIVLEEKKWTYKTTRNILIIVILGVCQIAVGAILEVAFPFPGNIFGMQMISLGMGDLIYAVSCCFSGYFSFNDYVLNKVIAFATLSTNQLCNVFRSGFGQKAGGLSFQCIKQGICTAVKKLSSSTVKTVAKNCSVKIIKAITHGAIYAAADHVIESQLDKISEAITEAVHFKISEAIDDHSITSLMREMCSRYGPNSEKTISACFSNHIYKYKDKLSTSLSNTLTSVKCLINQIWSQFKKTKSKTNENTYSDYLEIIQLCENVVKAITECQYLFDVFMKEMNNVLDIIEEDLRTIISKEEPCRPPISEQELDMFVLSVCNGWESAIKEVLSECLNNILLSPVLTFLTNCLVDSTSEFISKRSKAILRNEDVRKQNVCDYKYTQANKKPTRNSQTYDDNEELLLELLRKRRNVAVFTEIMRRNVSVDANFLEMCCFILPKALKKEGVVLQNLEIIVERNGTYQRFSTTDEKCKKTTIIIAADSGIVINVLKNKTLFKGALELILSKIVEDDPLLNSYPADWLKAFVAERIDNAFNSQPNFPTMLYDSPQHTKSYFKINASVEHKVPYQHFHVDGKYAFNMKVDIDLRKEEKITSLNLIEDHIFKGFTNALSKINNHIHKVQDHLRYFSLSLEDFEGTNYEIVPQTNGATKGNFHCFATHYKLVMPFFVELNETCLEDFTISMSLNDQVTEAKPYSPCGPHIAYEISPNVHFKYLNKGTKGHVLINKECAGYSLSAKNCHIAGEIILPTGFQLQKTCRFLMLGDSIFETGSEVTSYPNFVALSFSNLRNIKLGVSNLTMFYKGIQCVVLIPGVSTSLSRISGGEITANIAEVMEKLQGQFVETKIVVCSIYKAKRVVSQGKVTLTNKCLKIHCSRMNIDFLDTNSFLSSDEHDNGIHLNKRGLKKIMQFVSKK